MVTQKGVSPVTAHVGVHPDWLALRVEDIVEPELKIIDPHHHLWDLPGNRYLFDDFLADVGSGHDIRATVFAPCRSMYRAGGPAKMRPIGETEFITGVAAQSASGKYGPARLCAGIIGALDLSLGERNAPVLESHLRVGGERFRGIRGRTSWHESAAVRTTDTPPGVLMASATRQSMALIAEFGLSFDIWCFHTQLPEVIDACRSFPQLPIIVNHVGGPVVIGPHAGKRDEVFVDWRRDIAILSELPNTFMKIGGLGMQSAGFDFHNRPLPPSSDELVEAWRPYVETCIEAFGADRCMFESNFPVDKASCSYPVLWNAFKKMAAGCSFADKEALFFGTAARVYKINPGE